MNKIKMKLENCYGIKKMEYEFNFETKKACLIYAPNGTMKTSFAKTCLDISKDRIPKDQVKNIVGTCMIENENNISISNQDIFVINSYERELEKRNLDKLLVSRKLKDEYEELIGEIKTLSAEFTTKVLKSFGGNLKKLEEEFLETFGAKMSVKEIIKVFSDDVEKITLPTKYNDLFNAKTILVMKKKEFKKLIGKYIDSYDRILEGSKLFSKGKINHSNLNGVIDSLKSNNFFSIENKIILATGEVVTNIEMFELKIEEEKNRIVNNPEMIKVFEQIDSLLKNAECRELRDILEKNRFLIVELENLNEFRKKVFMGYFNLANSEYENLRIRYGENEARIREILERARTEETDWEKVLEIFNHRFDIPFKLELVNKGNSLIGTEEPQIEFKYDNETVTESKLKDDILSTGEKRALYILEVIYELEVLKKNGIAALLILDDIADSFDYKNKYAIIEYLKDIIEDNSNKFNMIILTHNFDFYRTVGARLNLKDNSLMAIKKSNEIELQKGKYFANAFDTWRSQVYTNEKIMITVIPFVRNLIEYSVGSRNKDNSYNEDYLFLTNLLHYKAGITQEITVRELKEKYQRAWFKNVEVISNDDKKVTDIISNDDKKVIDIIFLQADIIKISPSDSIILEDKIILSIASRLKLEMIILSKLLELDEAYKIVQKNQTFQLIKDYKTACPDCSRMKLIESVNLMTAENIHINSFMYEPLLDMPIGHLKKIYNDLTIWEMELIE